MELYPIGCYEAFLRMRDHEVYMIGECGALLRKRDYGVYLSDGLLSISYDVF
jgi:hypothetical protein